MIGNTTRPWWQTPLTLKSVTESRSVQLLSLAALIVLSPSLKLILITISLLLLWGLAKLAWKQGPAMGLFVTGVMVVGVLSDAFGGVWTNINNAFLLTGMAAPVLVLAFAVFALLFLPE